MPFGGRVEYDYRACPILGETLRYWDRRRGPRTMPARRDIDPVEIPRLLSHLQLTEVVAGGARFRVRLVGTAIVDAFGLDFTGKHVDEFLAGERCSFVHDYYRRVCAARQPVFVRSKYLGNKELERTANRLLLPLSEDGAQVDKILSAMTFEFAAPRGARIGRDAEIDLAASRIEAVEQGGEAIAG